MINCKICTLIVLSTNMYNWKQYFNSNKWVPEWENWEIIIYNNELNLAVRQISKNNYISVFATINLLLELIHYVMLPHI